ncbi:MAG TPA: diacylglycerol kinase [Gammaproteobacteria bacterium]|jgi:diacylglycerol kinase (ATP)|nr:diacylglycerol kinase [Gammaproteobacteria bacterium]
MSKYQDVINTFGQIGLKLYRSMQYSIVGLKSVWQTEQSFRLEIYLCLILIPVALVMPFYYLMKLILIQLALLLLVAELINTSIEAVVDRISLEIHPQSKLAKDACCAAVGLVILMNFIAWVYAVFSLF